MLKNEKKMKKGNRKIGRPINIKMAKKVQVYRKKGLSYREIEKLTGKCLSQIFFWDKLDLEKLAEYDNVNV